jgi:hypothetical protein
MAKASRVRYTGTAPFIDDAQANRVQALGSSSRLTTEDMKELGTLNIVEIVDDVPQVDVSVDSNENGTNELLGLLSNKGYGCQVEAVPSGGALGTLQLKVNPGRYYAKTGHSVLFEGATITANATGNQLVYLNPVASSANASAKVGIASSLPAGAIQIASLTPSGSIVKQADITDSRPFASISVNDFELAKADIFVPVKQSGDGLNGAIARTMYMERVFANNIDFSFQVQGVATASYRLETDNKRWFLNSASQMVVDEFLSTGSATHTLSNTPFALANGNKMLKVTKNGTVLVEGTDFTVSGTTLTLTPASASGDLIKARYTSANNGKFFAPVPALEDPHPEIAGGIKEGQIELYLVDANGTVDANRTTRVQSARISVPLQREPLAELGSLYPYDRPLALPVNVSVSLELKDSDLELMARFAGYSNLASANEIALDDLVKNKGLLVKIYRETDVKRAKLATGHPDKYAVKTIYVKNLIPQSESWDVRVDSDATQNFEFLAHNITITDKYLNANQVS